MGFGEDSNMIFVNVSNGFLQNRKKDIQARSYTGLLENMERKEDEYEGKKINKIQLFMRDTEKDERVCISFTEDTWFSVTFFQRFEDIDRNKPFTVGVSGSDQNEKVSFCWMKQDGNKIGKGDISLPEKKKIGNREVYDHSVFLMHVDNILSEYKDKKPAQDPGKIYDDDGTELF